LSANARRCLKHTARARFPIHGRFGKARAGTARHDAVALGAMLAPQTAWALTLFQNCEVTGFLMESWTMQGGSNEQRHQSVRSGLALLSLGQQVRVSPKLGGK